MQKKTAATMFTALLTIGLAACGSSDRNETPMPPPPPAPEPGVPPAPAPQAVGGLIALTADNKLVSFDPATPGTLIGSVAISGMPSGENLVGIDLRPADGLLYGLAASGTLYTLDPMTGIATPKSTLGPAAGDDAPFAALTGTRFAVDFNPVADRLRVISDTGLNLRINVDTGAAITDGKINGGGAGAAVTAAAYTNSFAGTATTQLFSLDTVNGIRYLQDPPNDGTLAQPLPLGLSASALNGFDIDARTNRGWAVFGDAGQATLVSIDVATGTATAVDRVGTGEAITGLVINDNPKATAWGLTSEGALVRFDPAKPTTLLATLAVSGLAGGEQLVGIDVRPADGGVYGLTSAGRIIQIDTASGAATPKSTLAADPADATLPFTALDGTVFTVDFNPVVDRLRVVSDTGQNLRINVDTGATTTDGVINRAAPATVVGGAYASNFAGTTATVLYDLDAAADVLATQTPPNDGTLVDIGPLGVDLTGAVGFDIAGGANGLALVAIPASPTGPSLLRSLSLTTAQLVRYPASATDDTGTQIGGPSGPRLIDIAISLD